MRTSQASWGSMWSAVIVNRNASVFLDGCLRALARTSPPPAAIVVVDNASTDDSLLELNSWPEAIVEPLPQQRSLGEAANIGVSLTETPLVLLLQPTIEVEPDLGEALTDAFRQSPELAVLAVALVAGDHSVTQSKDPALPRHRALPQRVGSSGQGERFSGQAFALRRAAFDEVGGFDPSYWPAYFEADDLASRLEAAGWLVNEDPAVRATRLGSGLLDDPEADDRWYQRNRLRFALKRLPPSEWWGRFLPGEIQRIRRQLGQDLDSNWPVQTGADAIEWLARGGPEGDSLPSLGLDADPLLESARAIDALRQAQQSIGAQSTMVENAERRGRRPTRRSLDEQASERAEQQRRFNDAVLRAFDAQDRLNRELVTSLLTLMLGLARKNAQTDRLLRVNTDEINPSPDVGEGMG